MSVQGQGGLKSGQGLPRNFVVMGARALISNPGYIVPMLRLTHLVPAATYTWVGLMVQTLCLVAAILGYLARHPSASSPLFIAHHWSSHYCGMCWL